MIEIRIMVDEEKGSKGKCDAKNSCINEVAMMLALLNKYRDKIQKQFNKLADVEYDIFKDE